MPLAPSKKWYVNIEMPMSQARTYWVVTDTAMNALTLGVEEHARMNSLRPRSIHPFVTEIGLKDPERGHGWFSTDEDKEQ